MVASLFYVAVITCFFSFGVQTLFYVWYFIRNEPIIDRYKTVFNYYSGIIGDSTLMPATNIFAVMTLERLGSPYFDFVIWLWAILVGLFVTFIFHYGQKHFKLTNWTMPQTGKWTLLGIYHSLFMFAESSFLAFSLLSFLKHLIFTGNGFIAGRPVLLGLGIMVLFFATFIYDYWKPLFGIIYHQKLKSNYLRVR